MLYESLNDRVYFSAMLPSVCPNVYKGLTEVLDRYGVPHHLLEGTNDIWCRDYMPLQCSLWDDRLAGYVYSPDYLHSSPEDEATITDGREVARRLGGFYVSECGPILDGGNVVMCGHAVVMTAKVLEENAGVPLNILTELFREMFQVPVPVVLLPWDTREKFGHADGICRYAEDDDTIILTNYTQFDDAMAKRFRKCLEPYFKRIVELHYDVKPLNKSSWAYINFLQTDKVIIVPGLGTEADALAVEQIEAAMPSYKGRIEQVDAREVVRLGGGFNCCSWTVKTPEPKIIDLPWPRKNTI